MIPEQKHLSKELFRKSTKSGKELGWKKVDFPKVIEFAKKNQIGIVGGQVQFVFPDGICELYWRNYDPEKRRKKEFDFLRQKADKKVDLEKYLTFILYFDFSESQLTGKIE